MRVFRMRMEMAQRMDYAENTDGNSAQDEEVLAATDIPAIMAHGGSSLGNIDSILPLEYPLPPSHPLSPFSSAPHPLKAGYVNSLLSPSLPSPAGTASRVDTAPKITLISANYHLHSRPAELYLGASTSAGQLRLYIYYDRNVFEPDVVREWLDEVKAAILWYLGRTHQSCQIQQRSASGQGEGPRAKL
ncbi:hypothetical protein JVU11DRAFT_8045 [Chiua virens]|nr:hypothetical protein JVU11DRAFT_8045 [Chiua virens]